MGMMLEAKISMRSWARRMGLITALVKVKSSLGHRASSYEDCFATGLLNAVRSGDCAWDIGANIGYYAALLSERVGPTGTVCAFEPAPECFKRIERRQLSNTKPFQLALGDRQSTMKLNLSPDPLGDTHSLVDDPSATSSGILVEVVPGDTLVEARGLPMPNIIKIDVEGFEEEVLLGLSSTLKRPECRAVFCEVHFGTLERRGKRRAPAQIEARLRELGFQTRWLDSSHLAATRQDGA